MTGAITITNGKATNQLFIQAANQMPKTPSTKPVELTVDTPETTQLINMESIKPNIKDAYFAGIILNALRPITD